MAEPENPSSFDLVEKYILALLGAQDQEDVPEKLWLTKELFLLSKMNDRLAEEAGFRPYLQGPWSEEVEYALEDLQSLGLVDYGESGNQIRLTPQGRSVFEQLQTGMPDEIEEQIADIKDLLNDLSEEELLVFTYFTHPEMTTDSVVKDKAEENRVEAAKSLYRKEKVSLEKAAELAGMKLREFQKELRSEGA